MAKRRGNGEGSVTRRKDGRWQASVSVGKDENGNPIRKYYYGRTRKEVVLKLAEAANQVRTGTYTEPSKLVVREWFERWLEHYKKGNIDQSTFESYKDHINLHILPELGHIKLSKLKTFHLQELYHKKLQDGARRDSKPGGLSARVVRYLHMISRQALEQAKVEGLITVNPCDAAKPPRLERKEVKVLDSDQVALFLKEAKPCRYYTAFLLDLNTGMRRGEVLALQWDDINFETGEIQVRKTIERSKEYGLRIKNHTKNKKNRPVSAAPAVIETLKFWKARIDKEKKDLGNAYLNNNLVFPNEIGGITCPRAFSRQFERAIERCNNRLVDAAIKEIKEETGKDELSKEEIKSIEQSHRINVSPHSLRHTFATLSLQEGCDPKSIQEALGHHSAAFTLDVYAGVTQKMRKESNEKIGKLLTACLP